MDLDTSAHVAKVSSPTILKIKLNTNHNLNFSKSENISFESTNGDTFKNENIYSEQDYIITSPSAHLSTDANIFNLNKSCSDSVTVELSSDVNFNRSRFNNNEYFVDHNLKAASHQCCETSDSSIIDENVIITDELLLPNDNIDANNETLKYQHIVCNTSSTSEFINPESVLEVNSELVHSQDKADFNALALEYLSIPENIEPHFIVGNFSESDEKLKHNLNENPIDSGDMGIENTW